MGKTNLWALTGLAFAVIGLFINEYALSGALAIVFSAVGLVLFFRTEMAGGTGKGRVMSIVGLVFGVAETVFYIWQVTGAGRA